MFSPVLSWSSQRLVLPFCVTVAHISVAVSPPRAILHTRPPITMQISPPTRCVRANVSLETVEVIKTLRNWWSFRGAEELRRSTDARITMTPYYRYWSAKGKTGLLSICVLPMITKWVLSRFCHFRDSGTVKTIRKTQFHFIFEWSVYLKNKTSSWRVEVGQFRGRRSDCTSRFCVYSSYRPTVTYSPFWRLELGLVWDNAVFRPCVVSERKWNINASPSRRKRTW